MLKRIALVASMGVALASCQDGAYSPGSQRAAAPIPPQTLALMEEKGMSKSDPILIRSYKKESELEIWKRDRNGRYALLKSYPICRWSGQLGPKVREGDRQAPEGFYTITPAQMNPNSSYYLSFDTGFPNAYDRANGRSGRYLMVHGACSSAGCYSMTDEQIAEIYAIAREAFAGGQRSFQFQAYPFHMTPENLAKHRKDPNIAFWRMLKEGSDHFEVTKLEPKVGVCGRRYVFDATPASPAAQLDPSAPCPELKSDPAIAEAVAQKEQRDEAKIAELVREGTPAIKLVYQDGDQNASFRASSYASTENRELIFAANRRPAQQVLDVSRPEALASGPQEIVIDDGTAKPKAPEVKSLVAVAAPPAAEKSTSAKSSGEAKPVLAAAVDAKPASQPFFKRIFSFGSSSSASAGTTMVPVSEPAAPVAVSMPLPPSRQSAGVPTDKRAEAPVNDGQPAATASASSQGGASERSSIGSFFARLF